MARDCLFESDVAAFLFFELSAVVCARVVSALSLWCTPTDVLASSIGLVEVNPSADTVAAVRVVGCDQVRHGARHGDAGEYACVAVVVACQDGLAARVLVCAAEMDGAVGPTYVQPVVREELGREVLEDGARNRARDVEDTAVQGAVVAI